MNLTSRHTRPQRWPTTNELIFINEKYLKYHFGGYSNVPPDRLGNYCGRLRFPYHAQEQERACMAVTANIFYSSYLYS